jgi:hypothetical protein
MTCDGLGACRGSCTSDAQCKSGYYCTSSSGGTCTPKKSTSTGCGGDTIDGSGGHQCQTGYCVDGYCCTTACNGQCQACSASRTGAANGACTSIPANTDPDGECLGGLTCNGAGACRATCSADAQCEAGYFCTSNSSGSCVARQATGTLCGGDSIDGSGGHQCQTGYCVDGYCCNAPCGAQCQACSATRTGAANGACTSIPANTDPDGECAGGLTCNGAGACRTNCTADSQCEGGYFCTDANGGACVGKNGNGTGCGGDSIDGSGGHQCTSGNCIDGYCCNTACAGTCQSCNVAGLAGTCSSVPGGVVDNGCTGPNACNGSGGCCADSSPTDVSCGVVVITADDQQATVLSHTGNIPVMAGEAWIQINASNSNWQYFYQSGFYFNPFDLKIWFANNAGDEFQFQVYSTCAGGAATCPDGGQPIHGTSDLFELKDGANNGTAQCYGTGNDISGYNDCVSYARTLYVRVTRRTASWSCNTFTISVTNNRTGPT